MTPIDSLVDSYLGAVAWAVRDVSPQRREDLLADLREHIAAARAELDPETEAGVRTILDRLGDPESIAAEARRDEPPSPTPMPPFPAVVPPRRSRPGVWIGVAVAAVLGVVLVICVVGFLGFARMTLEPGEVERQPAPAEAPTRRPAHTG